MVCRPYRERIEKIRGGTERIDVSGRFPDTPP
jgi:hypothetical protein